MKKLLIFALIVITMSACSLIDDAPCTLSVKNDIEAVHFFQLSTCSYSKQAKVYIQKSYPDLKVKYIDLDSEEGQELMCIVRHEYNLPDYVQTPVICYGESCIQGWNEQKKEAFDQMVKALL